MPALAIIDVLHPPSSMTSVPADLRKSTAIEALREATRILHEALDSSLPIARAEADIDDYVAHLQAVHGWLAPLERCLAATTNAPRLSEDPTACSLSRAIEDDLRDAGAALPSNAEMQIATRELPYLWGQAYVAAGSQLGGAMLYKRLSARLAPHPMRYFAGTRISPSLPWPEFIARLNAAIVTPADLNLCLEGAIDAFTSLTARFRAPAPSHDLS